MKNYCALYNPFFSNGKADAAYALDSFVTAIYSTTERPTTILVSTVVDEALLAEESLFAEGFRIYSNHVARLYVCDRRSDFLHKPESYDRP